MKIYPIRHPPYHPRVQAVRVRLELWQPIHADISEQQHGGHGQPLALRSHGHREYEEAEGGREEAMILQVTTYRFIILSLQSHYWY